MKNEKLSEAKKYITKHKKRSVWYNVVMAMAIVVVFATTYMLILPALTMENGASCGQTEHTHSEECYETALVLTCGEVEQDSIVSDSAIETGKTHTHNDACYSQEKKLVCGLTEHTHTDDCYKNDEQEKTVDGSDVITDNSNKDNSDDEQNGDSESDEPGDLSPYIDEIIASVPEEEESNLVAFNSLEEASDLMTNITSFAVENAVKSVESIKKDSYYAKYDPDSNTFDTLLQIGFSPSIEEVRNDYKYTFTYDLPEEVVALILKKDGKDIELGEKIESDTTYNGIKKFDYYFEYDEETKQFNVTVIFNKDYIDALEQNHESLTEGYVRFEVHLSAAADRGDGDIEVDFGGDLDLDIPKDKIYYPEDSNPWYDISSQKSGIYIADDNTLQYTVVVYSQKGTSVITLDDTITGLEGLDAKYEGAKVKKAMVQLWGDSSTGYSYGSTEITNTAVNAVSDSYDPDTGKLQIELPQLDKSDDPFGTNVQCEAYEVTYSFALGDLPEDFTSAVVNNKVTATTQNGNNGDNKATSSASNTITVQPDKPDLIKKTGTGNGESVSWKIVVADDPDTDTKIEGGILTDKAFEGLKKGDITIVSGDGRTTGYTINTDDDGNVKDITFADGCDSKYTITYNTSLAWGESASNSANLSVGGKDHGTGTVWAYPSAKGGGVSKTLEDAKDGYTDNGGKKIKKLTWKIAINVPENGGVPEKESFKDTLYNVSDGHYMNNSDIESLISSLNSLKNSGIDFNLDFTTMSGETFSYTDRYTGGYSDKIRNGEVVVTGFTFSFPNGVPADKVSNNLIEIEYQTSVDTSMATSTMEYKNKLENDDFWIPDAYYKYEKGVTKTDGDGNVLDKKPFNEDGEVVWKVKVRIDNTSESIVVNDTMPDVIDAADVKVAVSLDNKEYASITKNYTSNLFSSYMGGQITSTDNNIISTQLNNINSDYVYLRYTCEVKEAAITAAKEENPNKDPVFELKNDVNVMLNEELFDTSTQTQTLTVGEKKEVMEEIDKSHTWNAKTKELEYSIDMNPNGDSFGENGTYDFVDTLYYVYNNGYDKIYREYTLDMSSVKLYYARKQVSDNGKSVLVIDDTKENGGLVSNDKWSYTSSESENGSVKYSIINATFPDETPLIFKYTYDVNIWATDGASTDDAKLEVSNSAHIVGDVDRKSEETIYSEKWNTGTTSADINQKPEYVIYKIAEDKYNNYLKGAVFGLYEYGVDESLREYESDEDGMFTVKFNEDELTDGTNLKPNTIYYLKEITPPTGYKLPSSTEKLYFYVLADGKEAADLNPPEGSINLTNNKYTKYITNAAVDTTDIKVTKKWVSASGSEIDAKDKDGNDIGSISYTVKRKYTDPDNLVTVSYKVTDWSNKVVENKVVVPKGTQVTFSAEGFYADKATSKVEYFNVNGDDESGDLVDGKADPANEWDNDPLKWFKYTFVADEDVDIDTYIRYGITAANSFKLDYDASTVSTAYDTYTVDPDFKKSGTIKSADDWADTISDLPTADMKNGKYVEYIYYVVENDVPDGYTSTVTGNYTDNVTITNKKLDTYIKVKKIWYNSDNTINSNANGDPITYEIRRKVYGSESGAKGTAKLNATYNYKNGQTVSKSFEEPVGTKLKLVIKSVNPNWPPDISIKIGSEEVEKTGYYNGMSPAVGEWKIDDTNHYSYEYEFVLEKEMNMTVDIDYTTGEVENYDSLIQVESSTSAADDDSFLILDEPYEEHTISAPLWSSNIDIKELPISGSITGLTYEAADGTSATYNGVVTYKYYVREVVPNGYTASYLYTINGDSNVVDNTQLGYDYLYLFSPSDIVDGKESVITIENYPKEDDGVSLPNTGGRGTIVYTAAGLLMMAFAACGLYIKTKRQGGLHE